MTQDAASQLQRLLHLIPLLADGEVHSIADVARRAQSDPETIVRDLYSLSERFGDPGGFVPGLNVLLSEEEVSVRTSHFLRPMRLTVQELAALALGLAMLRREAPPEEQVAIDGARARLAQALVALPASSVQADLRHAETGAAADPSHLRTLRTGVRQRRRTRIRYRSARAADASDRVICPYGLVASRGAWYLVAHCDTRQGLRIFRLDRVETVSLTEERFERPQEFSLDDVIRDGRIFRADEPAALRVRYSPRIARWIAEREDLPLAADGSLTVEHPLADASWALRHVLQYGPDAEVLEPAEVRDEVVRALRNVAGSTGLDA